MSSEKSGENEVDNEQYNFTPKGFPMKTFHLTIALPAMLLLGLTTAAFAQPTELDRKVREALNAIGRSSEVRMHFEKQMVMNSLWNDDGSVIVAMQLFQEEKFREGFGVSDEQNEKIWDARSKTYGVLINDPSIKQIQEELGELIAEGGDSFQENATEEMRQRLFDLSIAETEIGHVILQETMANAVSEILTPDQIQKIREFQISAMSEIMVPSPRMFEALDLSDAQKKQLDGIKKEMQPEFEKYIDMRLDIQSKWGETFREALGKKLDGVEDPKERERIVKEVKESVQRANPAHQRESNEIEETGKKFVDKLKIRMFDVLTDEQWKRMLNLIDNPPDYVEFYIKTRKEQRGESEKAEAVGPGPNSWKPGDPIPEGYRQQRQERGRFPRPAVNQSK